MCCFFVFKEIGEGLGEEASNGTSGDKTTSLVGVTIS